MPFVELEVLNFNDVQSNNLQFFWIMLLVSYLSNPWPNLTSQRFSPVFPSINFVVLCLTFRPMVYFELIFVYVVK